ncbi:ATP-binding protein [Amycolatopsis coloradensis]|uniref:ATP-binding protein n=1 Tax=Amycolatopsis coloradensis TaxID=76021 RepID=UPI001178AA52|nr:ATP-binding protein [Amycolatopsis coloradensis]
MVGLTVALLGVVLCATAVGTLLVKRISPLSEHGRVWAIVGGAGAVLLLGGLALAILVPSPDRRLLARIARVADQVVQQCDRRDGFTVDQYADLGVRSVARPTRRTRPLNVQMVAETDLTVVCGPAGSGKSMALRALARDYWRRTQRSRRPETVVLYVDLAEMGDFAGPVTAEIVRDHLLSSFDNDIHLRAAVAGLLERADPRIRCIFVLDFGAASPSESMKSYMDEVMRLVRRHSRNHAVIASRSSLEMADLIVEVGRPNRRHRERLLRRHGMTKVEYGELMARLDGDPELAQIADLPAILAMVARHRSALSRIAAPSHDDFIDLLIQASFDELDDAVEIRQAAEWIAFRVQNGEVVGEGEITQSLTRVGIGTVFRGRFDFRAGVIQEHLAAGYLVKTHATLDVVSILDSPQWLAVLSTALRRQSAEFSASLMAAIETVVLLDPAASDHDGREVSGTFRWAQQTLRALEVLRCGVPVDREAARLSEELRAAAGRLIRRAVFSGGKAQQRAAASVLQVADMETARVAADRLVLAGDSSSTRLAVERLLVCAGVFSQLTFTARLAVLVCMVFYGHTPGVLLGASRPGYDRDLVNATAALAKVFRIAAYGAVVFAVAISVREPVRTPFSAALIVASVVFLRYGLRPDRSRGRFARVVVVLFLIAVVLVAANGITGLREVVAGIITFDFAVGFTAAVASWLLTWPAAAIGYIAAFGATSRLMWLPHIGLLQVAWTEGVMAARRAADVRRWVARWLWPRRVIAGVTCGILLLTVAIGVPAPAAARENIHGVLVLVAVFAFFVSISKRQWSNSAAWRRLRWDHRNLSKLDADELFSELTRSFEAGSAATSRLLSAIRNSNPGELRVATAMLVDLDNLMEFLAETLPDKLAAPIKDGFWQLAPSFQQPGFGEWVAKFDNSHPGMLVEFAASPRERELLSEAVLRAQGHIPIR